MYVYNMKEIIIIDNPFVPSEITDKMKTSLYYERDTENFLVQPTSQNLTK